MTELAVLVPVLNRPANVAPLVESFLDGCPEDSTLFFLANASDRDEIQAIYKHLFPPRVGWIGFEDTIRTWPQKICGGVQVLPDFDWYLFAADDITFTPGWWEATAELRADPTIGVIGTNDSFDGTGNPAVAAGEHTCHPLVRASYIRDRGTWDGPGQAVCPEYHHWFVDNELVITAKMRWAWGFARDAYVIHHHPYWKGTDAVPWDDTYTLGEANAEEDKQTWFRRAAKFGPLQPGPRP